MMHIPYDQLWPIFALAGAIFGTYVVAMIKIAILRNNDLKRKEEIGELAVMAEELRVKCATLDKEKVSRHEMYDLKLEIQKSLENARNDNQKEHGEIMSLLNILLNKLLNSHTLTESNGNRLRKGMSRNGKNGGEKNGNPT